MAQIAFGIIDLLEFGQISIVSHAPIYYFRRNAYLSDKIKSISKQRQSDTQTYLWHNYVLPSINRFVYRI